MVNNSWAALAALVIFAAMNARRSYQILNRQVVRNDPAGLGHFGAPRGNRTHQGLDLVAVPGTPVYSPVTGKFVRAGRPYANDNRYQLVVIHGQGKEFKLMYVEPLPTLKPGDTVRYGKQVGTAQDIAAKYGQGMLNHIHVEVRTIVGADLLDPAPLLNLA